MGWMDGIYDAMHHTVPILLTISCATDTVNVAIVIQMSVAIIGAVK